MRKIALTLMTLVLVATAATAQMSCSCTNGKATVASKKRTAVVIKCPVTGEKIASAAKAGEKSVYKGKAYYFCCPMCKPKFDKAPAKYIKNAAKGVYEKM